MSLKKFPRKIQKEIEQSDPERLNGYIDMFDRLLLYNLAAASLPAEIIEDLVEKWEQTIKSTINIESSLRSEFLETTPQGRVAKMQSQPDGEDFRLLFLHTLNTAKTIVMQNLIRNEESQEPQD